MNKFVRLLLIAALSFASLQALAQRQPVLIVNHENILVERPGGKATAAEVKQAIMAAANATGRQWVISEPNPGRLLATYHVRTHTVVTEITYSAERFSVVYHDSVNMKYTPSSGTGLIHPFYNRWVEDFVMAIRTQLAKT